MLELEGATLEGRDALEDVERLSKKLAKTALLFACVAAETVTGVEEAEVGGAVDGCEGANEVYGYCIVEGYCCCCCCCCGWNCGCGCSCGCG